MTSDFTDLRDEYLNNPIYWFRVGDRLKEAAENNYLFFEKKIHRGEPGWVEVHKMHGTDISYEGDYSMFRVYKMLSGMSIENYLKGMIVKRNGNFQMDRFGKNHDLVGLCGEAGISISDDEMTMLRDLSAHVIWAGRYPAPKKESDLAQLVVPGSAHLFSAYDKSEREKTVQLLEKMTLVSKS